MKSKFWAVWVIVMVLCLFICCKTTVPITYTEPARVNMSGIKRIGIESNNPQVATTVSQRISSIGLYTIGTASEITQWRTWSVLSARQRQATEITAVDLVGAYAENVPRADTNYGNGKTLRITGVVSEIESTRGRYYVRITGSGNDAVIAFFAASEINRVIDLDRGQTITFVGECYGRNIPNDEDIAEILRLLGAGNRVNVINGYFLVEDNYPGALDAVITLNTSTSVNNSTRTESMDDGSTIRYYQRSASAQINYQVQNARTISMIGQGVKSAQSRTYSNEDPSNLPAANELVASTLNEPLSEVIGEIIPTQRTINITLAKEKNNKAVKKEMKAVEKILRSKDYAGAMAAYGQIYARYKNFAAGYNQAILTEAAIGTEAAIAMMSALFRETNNPMARSALNDMQSRYAANQRAASQLSQ